MELPIGVIDLVVLLASIAVTIVVGLRLSGKNDSIEAYLLGGRDLPWWAIWAPLSQPRLAQRPCLACRGMDTE